MGHVWMEQGGGDWVRDNERAGGGGHSGEGVNAVRALRGDKIGGARRAIIES
jgi:hypothetical protein